MRGRKPKPTVLKDLHGSTEARNPDEPIPSVAIDAVRPPDHFSDEMSRVWTEALEAAPPGMLKSIDAAVLEVWVVARVLHRRALRAMANTGLVIPAPQTRYPIQNPYLAIVNRQALVMMRAASELGFSPTARPRVGVTAGGAELGARNGSGEGESLDQYLSGSPVPPSLH